MPSPHSRPGGGKQVLTARHRFFKEGAAPEGLVDAPILRSWQRCSEQGLIAARQPYVEPIQAHHLHEHHDRADLLLRLARPEIEALHSDAESTESIVILADASGLILHRAGSLDFADRASQVALHPGVRWSEDSMGTNAIGTAFIEKRPISVHGAEHFFEPHQILSCAAAPIFDPYGQLLGVLDLSCHAAVRSVHALGLVRLAVEQIEHRLFEHGFDHCRVLRFHRDAALLGTTQEAILVFEDDRLLAANRSAIRALGLDWSSLNRLRLPDLFSRAPLRSEATPWQTVTGLTFLGQATKSAKTLHSSPLFPKVHPVVDPGPLLSLETRTDVARAVRLLAVGIPILVQGETGTGKEVFARRVHAESERASQPFIAVNCAALPENLIESELFGYEEGAFTGARRKGYRGLMRQAEKGVLFLDEIGDMPLSLQARLLRVLQERSVRPLGGEQPIPVDFALICATHQPLATRVSEGGFRQDLFFRIAQYSIDLPALRHLPDRPGLVRTLWQRLLPDNTPALILAPETVTCLATYDWPGNYRQLLGVLRALLALAEPGRPIAPADLPAFLRPASSCPSSEETKGNASSLASIAKSAIHAALVEAGGNRSRAAQALGIDRSTLYRRLRQTSKQ